MAKSYYEVLGVPATADEKVIRTAYRKLAMRYHPDRQTGKSPRDAETAEATFKEVKEAYEILTDQDRRAAYDRAGALGRFNDDPFAGVRPGARPTPRAATPADADFAGMFNDLFTEMRRAADMQKTAGTFRDQAPVGDNIEQTLTLSMEDALAGCTRTVKVHAAQPCPRCHGSGARCVRCQGVGQVFEDRRWEIRVPPGMLDGARLRLKGAGHDGPRFGGPGALFVTVRWAPHPVWRAASQGEPGDLERDLRITHTLAQTGGAVTVRTITGQVGEITVPAGSGTGRRLRLKNQGWPLGRERGDAFLVLQVDPMAAPRPASAAPDGRSAWARWTARWSRNGSDDGDRTV